MSEENLRAYLSDLILTINTISCEECYTNRSNYSEEYLLDFIILDGWSYLDDKVLCPQCVKQKVTP